MPLKLEVLLKLFPQPYCQIAKQIDEHMGISIWCVVLERPFRLGFRIGTSITTITEIIGEEKRLALPRGVRRHEEAGLST